jgi:hypothetical protein
MFSITTDQTVEYVSLWDPSVDDSKLDDTTIQRYMDTRERGLLTIKAGRTPVVWELAPLSHYERAYIRQITPRDASGEMLEDLLFYHTAEIGIRGAKDLPDGAPAFGTQKRGALTAVVPEFFTALVPQLAKDLGYMIWSMSTLDEDAKKK